MKTRILNKLTLRLPQSLHKKIKELAQEATQASRADFLKVMRAVPDVEPEAFDRL